MRELDSLAPVAQVDGLVAHGTQDPPAEQAVPGGVGQPQRVGEVAGSQWLLAGVVCRPADIQLGFGHNLKERPGQRTSSTLVQQRQHLVPQVPGGQRQGRPAAVRVVDRLQMCPHAPQTGQVTRPDAPGAVPRRWDV